MPNIEQHNLRNLINNHFFDRDQTKEILENFVTVDNNSVLHVGLPEPTNVALTTPNNAITTADVGTLKAKVTGANNVNCYGVPVDFVNRKTREVIGQGITDINGEAYYNFRLEDSDIFSVQAKLSQDYLFHDGAILNNTATWGNSGNIVQEIYHDYTLIYKDDDSLDSLLYSPTLSGYTEISFKAKLVDAATSDSFCGLIETNSSGTVTGNLNGVTLSQLGLTAANNGQWYKFYINVLGTDVLIKAINLDTGAVSTASVTLSAAMSYFSFCFVLTGDLTTTYFSDVKINKCSDDLTMFVKDKNINYLFYDIGVISNNNNNWIISDSCTLSRGRDYSVIKESSASEWGTVRVNQLIPVNTKIEFDYKITDGLTSDFFCALSNTLTSGYLNGVGLYHFNGNLNIWYHMSVDIGSTSTTFTSNSLSRTIEYSSKSQVSFYYWLSRGISEVSFKNLKLYSN